MKDMEKNIKLMVETMMKGCECDKKRNEVESYRRDIKFIIHDHRIELDGIEDEQRKIERTEEIIITESGLIKKLREMEDELAKLDAEFEKNYAEIKEFMDNFEKMEVE